MKTTLAIAMLLMAGTAATAGTHVFVGIGVGGYYGARYYAPAPVAVYAPPPPAPYYYAPPCPGPGYVWVGGYYYPAGPRYAWRPGYWAHPPYAGAYWARPHYNGGRYYGGYWRR